MCSWSSTGQPYTAETDTAHLQDACEEKTAQTEVCGKAGVTNHRLTQNWLCRLPFVLIAALREPVFPFVLGNRQVCPWDGACLSYSAACSYALLLQWLLPKRLRALYLSALVLGSNILLCPAYINAAVFTHYNKTASFPDFTYLCVGVHVQTRTESARTHGVQTGCQIACS